MNETLFIWNFTDILFFSMLGVGIYIMAGFIKKERPESKFNPYLLGLSISLCSGFSVGLYAAISLALYVSFAYLWDVFYKYRSVKQ